MTKRQAMRYEAIRSNLEPWGFTRAEVDTLIRDERRLSRWAERECNEEIEREEPEEGGRPFRRWGQDKITFIPDREKGAVNRITKLCGEHGVSWYHQGDPRGCTVYILRPGDVPEGTTAESCYTNGLAVCLD